jgi:hypothetical protein
MSIAWRTRSLSSNDDRKATLDPLSSVSRGQVDAIQWNRRYDSTAAAK